MLTNNNYKSMQINGVKDRQKYLKNLHEQLNKSRMAVETITSFRNTEMKFKKKIDQIQQQLSSCVLRINAETKKNVILNELITLMKGEMFNFQKTQKREQQKNQSQAEKKVKKIQYDIEQILQKHNEQIAKITSLKQAASSGRSQRVVFSNLFKKLEKQIKQNEQLYKDNLMRSQLAKDKQIPIKIFYKALKNSNEFKQSSNRQSQTNLQSSFPFQNTFGSNSQTNDTAFITLQKSYENQQNHFNRKVVEKKNNFMKESIYTEIPDQKNSSRGFHDQISVYDNFLQKIKLSVGYDDIGKTVDYYQSIGQSNQRLSQHIDNYNNQIQIIQNLIRQINSQKRKSQCYDSNKDLPLGSFRRIKITTQKQIKQPQDQCGQIIQLLGQMGQYLNVDIQQQQDINEDLLKQLDFKLDMLLEQSRDCQQMKSIDFSHQNRTTTATTEINAVDILLDKMERFSQCQKLLDKNLFKQEYLKEISRNKKHKSKK